VVALAARDEVVLASVAEDISVAGGRALPVPTDVGDAASVERLVARTVDA
jgi:NADP-dependent 3-hydroxy acid dehydrogenase YdfG